MGGKTQKNKNLCAGFYRSVNSEVQIFIRNSYSHQPQSLQQFVTAVFADTTFNPFSCLLADLSGEEWHDIAQRMNTYASTRRQHLITTFVLKAYLDTTHSSTCVWSVSIKPVVSFKMFFCW